MTAGPHGVQTVVKIGGGLLTRAGAFELVTRALAAFGKGRQILVVPGGGPFAEAVRELFRRIQISADTAHWMAVLGMDQYALALAECTAGAVLVEHPPEIEAALAADRIPVLAPHRWLRAADPLPHSWDVTSDSISAWLAGAVGAQRLVLVKPITGDVPHLVDPYFRRALPLGVDAVIVTPHELEKLGDALDESSGTPLAHWRSAGEG